MCARRIPQCHGVVDRLQLAAGVAIDRQVAVVRVTRLRRRRRTDCSFGGIGVDPQVLQQEQSAAGRRDDVHVAVAIDVDAFRVQVEAAVGTPGDQVPLPSAVFAIEPIPIDHQRIVFARILAVVAQVTLAGHQVQLPVAVHVGQHQAMRLRPTGVDRVLYPAALLVRLGDLLQPVQADVVPAAPDHVRVAVAIDVVDQDGHSGIGVQRELRSPSPCSLAGIQRCFGPTARHHHVASAVAVQIAESVPMPAQLTGQIVPDPPRPNGPVVVPVLDHLVPSRELHPVGQDVQSPVAVDVVQPAGLARPRRVDHVVGPRCLQAPVFDPVQRLAAVVDADQIQPAVAVDVQRQVRVIVVAVADHLDIPQAMPRPIRCLVPELARHDVQPPVAVHVDRRARAELRFRIDRVATKGNIGRGNGGGEGEPSDERRENGTGTGHEATFLRRKFVGVYASAWFDISFSLHAEAYTPARAR
jgi:hypothetical protein